MLRPHMAQLCRLCCRPGHPSFQRLCSRAAGSTATPAEAKPAAAEQRSGANSAVQVRSEPLDTNPPRGTRDFPPEDYRLKQWLHGEFEAVSQLFGFEQFECPVLESEDLFVRKAGEEITQQLYNFQDKGGRKMSLRPELTPSLARLVLNKGKALPLPAKWFTIGQCWRYERTTRGRRREHYQWNMDIVGVPGVEAEAEVLSAITLLLQRLKLSAQEIVIKVSSRKVLQALVASFDVPADTFGAVCIVVDKLDKLPADKVEGELQALGLSQEAAKGVLSLTHMGSLEELEAALPGHEACRELRRLFELAEAYGMAEYLQFDPSIVRGLAYYTGIVFEGRDREGRFRAVFGGGRYDQLLQTFGGPSQPCVGFGFGDCVIAEILEDRGLLPSISHQVDDLIVAMDTSLQSAAAEIASRLRRQGRSVDLVLESKRMKWVFKQAERSNAKRLVIVGPDEWANGMVRVKDLAERIETDVPQDSL